MLKKHPNRTSIGSHCFFPMTWSAAAISRSRHQFVAAVSLIHSGSVSESVSVSTASIRYSSGSSWTEQPRCPSLVSIATTRSSNRLASAFSSGERMPRTSRTSCAGTARYARSNRSLAFRRPLGCSHRRQARPTHSMAARQTSNRSCPNAMLISI